MIVSIAQEEIAANSQAGWIHLARGTAAQFAPVGVGAAIGSLIAVQGVAIIVSLYHIITNRFVLPTIERHREEGRMEGLEEGRAEGLEEGEERANRAWRDWLREREEAEAEGRPFNEPPPDQREE